MARRFETIFPYLMVLELALASCNLANPATSTAVATGTPNKPTTALVTPTLPPTASSLPSATLPASTASRTPTNTQVPSETPSFSPVAFSATSDYIDDRSTPSQVIVSFYNAIGRQEYSRAYGYYSDPSTTLGAFTPWTDGYLATVSVDLVFGPITADPGMSQVYYSLPVILKAITKPNIHNNYAACYIVHETNPGVYGSPQASPMGMSIVRASAVSSSLAASDTSVLANACSAYPAQGLDSFSASANSLNIDKNNFIDNLSGAKETVSSLLNSLNLKQYVRAYSYYQVPATYPGPYDPYAAGYANTDTISVTFGEVQTEAAAGSQYFKVPLAEVVLATSGTTQTFIGCYTLRLAQPGNQITPPFRPMGIVSGTFNQVANGTSLSPLLSTACN